MTHTFPTRRASDLATGGCHMIGREHEASSLSYWTRLEEQTRKKRRWTYAEKVSRKAENAGSGYVPVLDANGFSGGRFETRGFCRERKLVEALNDGSSVEYGHVRFALGDPRSSGTWRSPDGSVALLGTRYYDVPRYGLEIGRAAWRERGGQTVK